MAAGWPLSSLAALGFCIQLQMVRERLAQQVWSGLTIYVGFIETRVHPDAQGLLILSDIAFALCVTWLTISLPATWRAWRKGRTATRLREGESAS
jgi:hypothetical protein